MERKMFLDKLPRHSFGRYKGRIDWNKSTGCKISFEYDEIIGEIKIINYNDFNKNIIIEYNSKIFWNKPIHISNLLDCKIGYYLNKNTKEFKVELNTIFKDNRRNITITNREYRKDKNNWNAKWYKYKCNICGWTEGWIIEGNLLDKQGCSCCQGRTSVLGINTIWDKARWMCDLGVSEEDAKTHTPKSNKKIKVTCPNCGSIKENVISTIYANKSTGCSCGDGFTYPEKLMFSILTQLDLSFKTQYSPEYLKRKENEKNSKKYSDFYIPNLKLVIETDGELGHDGGKIHSKSNKSLEECINVDKWKDEQNAINGVKTIRIDCRKSDMNFIKQNIINSKLNELFDLSKIDWDLADEYAIKTNWVKKVCLYWNNKQEHETTTDLEKEFNLSKTTIIKYLKQGAKYGLCDYDPKDESRKCVIRHKPNSKQIEIFKDGVSLGVFKSCVELEMESEKTLGKKLLAEIIYAVCNDRYNKSIYKGFTFKYKTH